ncbi:MAG TPA: sialate O-acetylesterase [Pyrinomonadaceae bacterium]|nr:sialate O-acetylesterase [Pyrinomonadaceae bacterium]
MRRDVKFILLALVLYLVAPSHQARAEVRTPSVIGENMVLQQGRRVRLWGMSRRDERLTITFAGETARTVADERGRWQAFLGPFKAGWPYTLVISGTNTHTFKNVMVGEVWVCSGQSNMEWPLARAEGGPQDAAAASDARLRFFTVEKKIAAEPLEEARGRWVVATPEEALRFSAVAFHFGRELRARIKVPVGLVHTSWGGTPAESWTSREALAADPALRVILERHEAEMRNLPELRREYDRKLAEWEKQNARVIQRDEGNRGEALGYADAAHDISDWQWMSLPQQWEQAGLAVDGVVWFRREVEVPARLAGRDLFLGLGAIDDHDTTYFNGERVGATGAETPNAYAAPRRYKVPGPLVRAGRNVVAVRVFDAMGGGGFGGSAAEMRLAPDGASSPDSLALDGRWAYKAERTVPAREVDYSNHPGPRPGPESHYNPFVLYNAMLAPLTPFAVRGAIWYQGESNAGRAYQYRALFPAMIRDWRARWGSDDFPFYFVQLANWRARNTEPAESDWAELREAQTLTMRSVPRTGMAVAIDIGEADDIHPRNKRDVGLRLARWALFDTYKQAVVPSGPLYDSHAVEGGRVRLRFKHARGLKTSDGRAPVGFAVAGEDRKFVRAEARVEGETVVVWSDRVARPVAVRYAWADNPATNLYNSDDLPASPFRTDAWPGVTRGNQ